MNPRPGRPAAARTIIWESCSFAARLSFDSALPRVDLGRVAARRLYGIGHARARRQRIDARPSHGPGYLDHERGRRSRRPGSGRCGPAPRPPPPVRRAATRRTPPPPARPPPRAWPRPVSSDGRTGSCGREWPRPGPDPTPPTPARARSYPSASPTTSRRGTSERYRAPLNRGLSATYRACSPSCRAPPAATPRTTLYGARATISLRYASIVGTERSARSK